MLKFWNLLIIFCFINSYSGYGQGLFENELTEQDSVKKDGIDFTGFVRASAFGGSELYDYSSVFGEFCLKSKLSKKQTFLYADLRVRSGLNYGEASTEFQLKEAYTAASLETNGAIALVASFVIY